MRYRQSLKDVPSFHLYQMIQGIFYLLNSPLIGKIVK